MKPKPKKWRISADDMVALEGNSERWLAYMAALHPTCIGFIMPAGDSRSRARFLRLVADAWDGSSKFQPTACRRRIIESYSAASHRHARCKRGLDVSKLMEGPTLDEVKREFEELFTRKRPDKLPPTAKLPKDDETFKRAFRELLLPWRKGKGGRPRGSKDGDPRKRRKTYLKKMAFARCQL